MDVDQKKALDTLKAVYDDGCAEINGRKYVFTKTTHIKRRKIFAYYTSVADHAKNQNFAFMGTNEFQEIENIISQIVTFEEQSLSKLKDHWDSFPHDYISFIVIAMGVISYPFLSGSHTA